MGVLGGAASSRVPSPPHHPGGLPQHDGHHGGLFYKGPNLEEGGAQGTTLPRRSPVAPPPSLFFWGGGGQRSGELVGGFEHLHEEGVDGGVPDELEEEEVLEAFEADGTQGREAEEQLGEPWGGPRGKF